MGQFVLCEFFRRNVVPVLTLTSQLDCDGLPPLWRNNMLNKDRVEIVATCDICHAGVMKQDSLHMVNDLLYCPECYEAAVLEGRIETNDD